MLWDCTSVQVTAKLLEGDPINLLMIITISIIFLVILHFMLYTYVHVSMPHNLYLLCMSESQHLIFYDIIKEGKISKGKSTKQKQHSIP